VTEAESSFREGGPTCTPALKDGPGAAKGPDESGGRSSRRWGRLPEAEKVYRAAMKERGEVAKDAPVEQRFDAARTRFLLATLLQMTGQLEESEKLHQAALEAYRAPAAGSRTTCWRLCGGLNKPGRPACGATKRADEAIAPVERGPDEGERPGEGGRAAACTPRKRRGRCTTWGRPTRRRGS